METRARHLDDELTLLRDRLLTMSGLVEEMLHEAVQSVLDGDEATARKVIRADDKVDEMELEIDELCLRLVGLRGPLAGDLRFILMAMRINSDLERIGDQARNIAKHSRQLAKMPRLKPYVDLPRAANLVQGMVHDSVEALVNRDASAAREIIPRDQQIDDLYEQVFRELLTYMMADPGAIQRALHILMIFRNFERIADHVTNICEDVVFIQEGQVLKHQY